MWERGSTEHAYDIPMGAGSSGAYVCPAAPTCVGTTKVVSAATNDVLANTKMKLKNDGIVELGSCCELDRVQQHPHVMHISPRLNIFSFYLTSNFLKRRCYSTPSRGLILMLIFPPCPRLHALRGWLANLG